jgi:L-alanine-DL-glutamate epimerase-like enolase superfamily enzyme
VSDLIASIEAGVTRLDLPSPIRIASGVIRSREYAAVRVTTESGLVGRAYCLTREAPVAACVTRLVSTVLTGSDSADPELAWKQAWRATVMPGRVGLVVRALGLVDIALWDIAAQRSGVPLWRLLGATRPRADVMVVAAYPTSDRSPEALADDVLRNASAGYRLLKVARDPDPQRMRRLLALVAGELGPGPRLVVDAAYAWDAPGGLASEVASWDAPPLAWLEDPLVPEDIEGYRALRGLVGQPIGAGDELSAIDVYRSLLAAGALDVLRLDVVCIGGFTPARSVLRLAAAYNVPVSFHVYPEMSAHLAVTSSALVETFERDLPGGNPLDPSDRLITGGPLFEGGLASLALAPGLGFDLDWDRFAMRVSDP